MWAVMGLPEPATYLLLVVLGYALTRIVDLACDAVRGRLKSTAINPDGTPGLSATARQRQLERRGVYARFRKSVNDAVVAAVNDGHGNYGLLYQIRDDYGDLLCHAPTAVSQAADSVIRCVTLLVNLGPSDQRFAMYTRALRLFDDACESDHGLLAAPPGAHRQEFSVLADPSARAAAPSSVDASPPGSDSASARAPT